MTATDVSKTEREIVVPAPELGEEPRPISWTAVTAFLLGLGSPLVLFSWCFLVFPLLAIFLGAVALWQTYEVEPVPSGRWAAWSGIFLGLLVTSGAVTYEAAVLVREEAQVDALFRQFLSYLRQGNFAKAHQLTRNPALRVESPEQVEKQYASRLELKRALENFRENLDVSFLASARKVELLGALTYAEMVQDKYKFLVRHYSLRVVTESGKEKEVTLETIFVRRLDRRGVGAWWLRKYTIPVDDLF